MSSSALECRRGLDEELVFLGGEGGGEGGGEEGGEGGGEGGRRRRVEERVEKEGGDVRGEWEEAEREERGDPDGKVGKGGAGLLLEEEREGGGGEEGGEERGGDLAPWKGEREGM